MSTLRDLVLAGVHLPILAASPTSGLHPSAPNKHWLSAAYLGLTFGRGVYDWGEYVGFHKQGPKIDPNIL